MYLITEQMRTGFGTIAWIARLTNLIDLNRSLERAKKERQRKGTDFLYQIVGDALQGWIVISDHQLIPEQRKMQLKEWTKRITDLYQKAAARIRRSRLLGRVSLVPHKKSTEQGTTWRRYVEYGYITHIAGQLQRHRINAERRKQEWKAIREQKSTLTALPDPF